MKKQLCILFLFVFGFQVIYAQLKHVDKNASVPPHPRIMLLRGDEQRIKDNISAEPVWMKVHNDILSACDKMIDLPVLERTLTGRRLLDVSREALRRIFYLSYAYRMTGEERYFLRAEKEILAVSRFSDWNPTHFLDVAEMTMAVAIGYDWLFDRLSSGSRETIKNVILSKGIDPSFSDRYNWFLTASNNWNQVCNAGMVYGALAIYEDVPEFSKMIIDRAVETVRLSMHDYAPDGAYPEGYGYWDYGTSFNVLLLDVLERIWNTDFGLSKMPGFMQTAGYLENMSAPSGSCFNYSDCGLRAGFSPAMFWFARKLDDPSLLWKELSFLKSGRNFTQDRILPAVMIWSDKISIADIQPPKETVWVGQGITPVALMRTSWTDPKAVYVGFKGGTASSNHAHMDVGSFVMEADGVRWASDFGMQDYNSLETRGVNLWNMRQNSQRWEVFRYNNFVHNTLTVNGQLQQVKGFADIQSYSDTPDFMNAVSDLSEVYAEQLLLCVRGIAVIDKQYVAVRDEIKTTDKETVMRWTMLTTANVKLTGKNTAELKKDGKTLKIEVTEPARVTMKTWTTDPPHDYDSPNPGTILVGFEVTIPANTQAALLVKLIPKGRKAGAKIPAIREWPKN